MIGIHILWLGRPWRFGPWHGFWHGDDRKYVWMWDVGLIRLVKESKP